MQGQDWGQFEVVPLTPKEKPLYKRWGIWVIVVVVLVAYFFGQFPATIIHDYGSLLAVIIWLFGFWWFVYAFVLETKAANVNE